MNTHNTFLNTLMERLKKLLYIDAEDLTSIGNIEYFRNKIFSYILIVLLIFALPIYIYDIIIFINEKNLLGTIVDILLFFVLLSLFSFNVFSRTTRKIITVSSLYLTGIFSIIITGSAGSGMNIILFSIIFTGFILEKTYFIKMLFANILIFIVLTLLLFQGYLDATPMASYKPTWLINVAVVQLCGIISFLLMNLIFEGFEKQVNIIKDAKLNVLESERKYKTMISNICDVIVIIDENNTITYVSSNIYDLYGWKPEELIGKSIVDNIHPEDRDYIKKSYVMISQKLGFKKTMEIKYYCKNGDIKSVETTAVNLIEDFSIRGILINFHDVTENKNRVKKILYLNNYDALTGLYNRTLFEQEMKEINTKLNLPLSVISADVDGLKIINDSLGHLEGDKLLKTVAKILKESCKEEDIISRVGGDEFYILLPNTDSEAVANIIRKIRVKYYAYNRTSDEPYYISISLGSSTKVDTEKSIEFFLKLADDTMYKHKRLKKKSLYKNIASSMEKNLFKRFPHLKEENKRITILATLVGETLGFSEKALEHLRLFVNMRNIGKIGVVNPDSPQDEFHILKNHSEIGYRIAKSLPYLNCIADSILTHNAHWDGNGYPRGLSGEDIELFVRIVSVVKEYDHMMQGSIDGTDMNAEDALKSLENKAGSKLDPEIVKVFRKSLDIYNKKCEKISFYN